MAKGDKTNAKSSASNSASSKATSKASNKSGTKKCSKKNKKKQKDIANKYLLWQCLFYIILSSIKGSSFIAGSLFL